MSTERILSILLGILMIIGGVYCLMSPGITYMILIWIIIAAMLASSISGIMTWSARKKAGIASGWDLCASIISLVFAIILIASFALRFSTMIMLLYFVMAWMIVSGITRIFAGLTLRKMHYEDGTVAGSNWGWVLCFGVLMVIAGLFGFAEPLTAAITIGIIIGVSLIVYGVELLLAGGSVGGSVA